MHAALAALLDVPPAVVLALVFVLPAIEASTLAGVVIPGETALLYGGVLAWHDRVPLVAVFAGEAALGGAHWAPNASIFTQHEYVWDLPATVWSHAPDWLYNYPRLLHRA